MVEIAEGPYIPQIIDSTAFSIAIRMQSNNFPYAKRKYSFFTLRPCGAGLRATCAGWPTDIDIKSIVTTIGCDIKILSTNLIQKTDIATDAEEISG